MIDPLAYPYLLPVAVITASLAISAGISGSNFWIPIYLLWLGIDPKTAFWLALLTTIFGFGSGVIGNVAHGTINRAVVRSYLVIAVPFTVLGTLLVPFAPVALLIGVFGVAIILYGIYRVYRFGLPGSAVEPCNPGGPEGIDRFLAAIGGFLQGLIATGVGMIVGPCLLRDGRIRAPAEAVGSTVAVVFVATLVATALRLTPDFIPVLASQGDRIVDIMIWVAPGVVVGGQLGPFLAKRLSARGIRVYVGVLMVFIGILICLRALSGS